MIFPDFNGNGELDAFDMFVMDDLMNDDDDNDYDDDEDDNDNDFTDFDDD